MGLFTKKSSTHFERDEKGKVVNVTHSGDKPREGDRLIKQYQEEKRKQTPSRWDQWKAKRAQEKQVYQKTYEKQKTRAIEARAKRIANERYNPKPGSRQPMFTWSAAPPSSSNANPFGSLFDFGVSAAPKPKSVKKSQKYVIRGGKAYPIAGTNSNKKKTSSKKKSSSGGYDMMDNWGFFK